MRTVSVQIIMRNENCQRKKMDRMCFVYFILFFKGSEECLKEKRNNSLKDLT